MCGGDEEEWSGAKVGMSPEARYVDLPDNKSTVPMPSRV